MTAIVDFIHARLGEDVDTARADCYAPEHFESIRTALWAIVRDHWNRHGHCERCSYLDEYQPGKELFPCPTVKNLATIWSDHPDYQEGWKP